VNRFGAAKNTVRALSAGELLIPRRCTAHGLEQREGARVRLAATNSRDQRGRALFHEKFFLSRYRIQNAPPSERAQFARERVERTPPITSGSQRPQSEASANAGAIPS